MTRALAGLALLLTLSSGAAAQDNSVPNFATSVATDPTTYAPALIYRAALKRDWRTSQPLFARGYVEANPLFTSDRRVDSAPLSYADGNAKINRLALRLMLDSAVHNVASQSLERVLLRNHPDKKKLIKMLGIVERIGVASYLTSANASKHFKQAQINAQMLRDAR